MTVLGNKNRVSLRDGKKLLQEVNSEIAEVIEISAI